MRRGGNEWPPASPGYDPQELQGPAAAGKIVYFIRHGQSRANISAVFQSPDSPLSETGRMQARSVAKRISSLSCEALIASPYLRARETAEAIATETGLEPEYSELFIERRKPSSINGKPFEDADARAIWRLWDNSLYSATRVADGENFQDLIRRADEALVYLGERKETLLAVVTHGFFLRTLVARAVLAHALNESVFRQFSSMASMENTGITVLHYHTGPAWRLWTYNDHAHLSQP